MNQAQLSSKAAALKAINSAKHKAAGRTHRIEVSTFTAKGAYVKTIVFYTTAADESALKTVAVRQAIGAGSKSISHSLDSAIIEALA